MTVFGESKSGVIFQTAGAGADPVDMFNVSVDNVSFQQMTIKQRKTTNTSLESAFNVSGPGSPPTRIANFVLDNVRVEHMEFGVKIRGSNWKIDSCQFSYSGPNNTTRRHIGVYGTLGSCFIVDNQSEDNGATGNTRFICPTSTTGTNPNETMSGDLVVSGNSQSVGSLSQFYNQDNWQGSAGDFRAFFINNSTNETSAFVVLYGTSANYANILSRVIATGNQLSNFHGGTPAGGKGMIAFDGAGLVSPRSSSLPVESSGNVLVNMMFRTDYTQAIGSTMSTVGYSTGVTSVTVTQTGGAEYAYVRLNSVEESGVTASRPTSPIAGQQFFDTTLGTPIWYNGSAWVNSSGTVV